jgi:hypothetical protein
MARGERDAGGSVALERIGGRDQMQCDRLPIRAVDDQHRVGGGRLPAGERPIDPDLVGEGTPAEIDPFLEASDLDPVDGQGSTGKVDPVDTVEFVDTHGSRVLTAGTSEELAGQNDRVSMGIDRDSAEALTARGAEFDGERNRLGILEDERAVPGAGITVVLAIGDKGKQQNRGRIGRTLLSGDRRNDERVEQEDRNQQTHDPHGEPFPPWMGARPADARPAQPTECPSDHTERKAPCQDGERSSGRAFLRPPHGSSSDRATSAEVRQRSRRASHLGHGKRRPGSLGSSGPAAADRRRGCKPSPCSVSCPLRRGRNRRRAACSQGAGGLVSPQRHGRNGYPARQIR